MFLSVNKFKRGTRGSTFLAVAILGLFAGGLLSGCSEKREGSQEARVERETSAKPRDSVPVPAKPDVFSSDEDTLGGTVSPQTTKKSARPPRPIEPSGGSGPVEHSDEVNGRGAVERPRSAARSFEPDEVAPTSPAPPPPPPEAVGQGAPPPAPAPAPAAAAAEQKPFDVVPVYFGTDRAVQPDPKRLQYGSERGHKLELGRALITVPSIHKVPQLERPWVIEIPYFKYKIYEQKEDPNKHFTVQEISSLSKDQLLALVRERLAASKTFKDHAFVFVHGFNTTFDNALYRTAQIAYDLKFDGAPFVYSWPSGGGVASYTYDRASVEQAEPYLTEFLNMVVKESGAKSISLIAHSMGNELLLRVLERARPQLPEGVVISQVILAAPDVDRDKFNIIAREITNFSQGVTLYAASNDKALGYSRQFWGGIPRAGDVRDGVPLLVPGIDSIDVTAVSTDALGLNHSGYAENPELLDDVKALLMLGIRPPDKRIGNMLAVETPLGQFWRYTKKN